MIQVTHAAIDKIEKEIERNAAHDQSLYVRLFMAVGWGGPRLQLALEESATPNDQVTKIEDITFIIDKNQLPYFQNVKLDFTKNFLGFGEFILLKI